MLIQIKWFTYVNVRNIKITESILFSDDLATLHTVMESWAPQTLSVKQRVASAKLRPPSYPTFCVQFAANSTPSANKPPIHDTNHPQCVRKPAWQISPPCSRRTYRRVTSCRPNCQANNPLPHLPNLDTSHTSLVRATTGRCMYIRLTPPHNSPVGAPHGAWEHGRVCSRARLQSTTLYVLRTHILRAYACDFH